MTLSFEKYEGLGNDFLVVDATDENAISAEDARRLCDRRFGVGGDGVLLVLPPSSQGSVARMRVINADGSVPEMCGNGLRCVVLHVARNRGVDALRGVFDTDAGPRPIEMERAGDEGIVTVDMGAARVVREHALELEGERVELVDVDQGNPHAIMWPVAHTHDRARIERFGPLIEKHAAYPRGTNVELVSFERDSASGVDALRLTVWERGVGFTLACGTGACATVAALVARGEWPEAKPARVLLPGGPLDVTIAKGRATMRGPARHVFSGRAS